MVEERQLCSGIAGHHWIASQTDRKAKVATYIDSWIDRSGNGPFGQASQADRSGEAPTASDTPSAAQEAAVRSALPFLNPDTTKLHGLLPSTASYASCFTVCVLCHNMQLRVDTATV